MQLEGEQLVVISNDSTATLPGVLGADRDRTTNPVNAAMRAAATKLDGARENVSLSFPTDDIARLRIRAFDGQQFTSELDAAFAAISF